MERLFIGKVAWNGGVYEDEDIYITKDGRYELEDGTKVDRDDIKALQRTGYLAKEPDDFVVTEELPPPPDINSLLPLGNFTPKKDIEKSNNLVGGEMEEKLNKEIGFYKEDLFQKPDMFKWGMFFMKFLIPLIIIIEMLFVFVLPLKEKTDVIACNAEKVMLAIELKTYTIETEMIIPDDTDFKDIPDSLRDFLYSTTDELPKCPTGGDYIIYTKISYDEMDSASCSYIIECTEHK